MEEFRNRFLVFLLRPQTPDNRMAMTDTRRRPSLLHPMGTSMEYHHQQQQHSPSMRDQSSPRVATSSASVPVSVPVQVPVLQVPMSTSASYPPVTSVAYRTGAGNIPQRSTIPFRGDPRHESMRAARFVQTFVDLTFCPPFFCKKRSEREINGNDGIEPERSSLSK